MALEYPSGKNGCFFDEKIVFTFYKKWDDEIPNIWKNKKCSEPPNKYGDDLWILFMPLQESCSPLTPVTGREMNGNEILRMSERHFT